MLLRYIEIESETRRAISILKMRDSNHAKGVWEGEIGSEGLTVSSQLTGVSGALGWSALRVDQNGDPTMRPPA